MSELETKRLLLVVTGASRGLGQAIAQVFCADDDTIICAERTRTTVTKRELSTTDEHNDTKKLQRQPIISFSAIDVFLIARTAEGLEQTSQIIQTQQQQQLLELQQSRDEQQPKPRDANINVSCLVADLSDLETLDATLKKLFDQIQQQQQQRDINGYDSIVFVNNAGSVGHVGPCISAPSLLDMQRSVDFNVTSGCWMSNRFAKFVLVEQQPSSTSDTPPPQTFIVNVSSLVAVQPFPTMAIYSAGKAARDAYHVALAKELKQNSNNIRILNYAPGPLQTAMVTEIRASPDLDPQMEHNYQQQCLLDPRVSAQALKNLLFGSLSSFESGAHIDYFDLLDNGDVTSPST